MIDITDDIRDCNLDIQSCVLQLQNHTVIDCTSFVYDFGYLNNGTTLSGSAWASVVTEMNLVCSQRHLDKLLLQATMIGLLLGSIFGGRMVDYAGRKWTLMLSVVMTMLLLLIPIIIRIIPTELFALQYAILFISRVLVQAFGQTCWIASVVYCIELVGPSKRAQVGCFGQYWFGLGWITSSLVGYLCPDWVDYSIISAVFYGMLLVGMRRVPPSIAYLLQAKKYSQGIVEIND